MARTSTLEQRGGFEFGEVARPRRALRRARAGVALTALGARAVAAAGGSRGGQDRWAVPVLPAKRGGRDRLR
jgi:hypothetical protein